MQSKINKDGLLEQKSYDKYACWCEDTMSRKAADIAAGKETIKKLQVLIEKLNADLAAIDVEIKQLQKDTAANIEAQNEATEIRDKENADYMAEKTESEQCIGALEAAIKILTGAGEGKKKGFLETMNQAQLLSVAADMRRVLQKDGAASKIGSQENFKIVQDFINHPQDFSQSRSSGYSAAQLDQNPFGDYAPQSTQIQGILKGMYDAFTSSLEKANAEEATKEKAFEQLMSTKKGELATLKSTLEAQQEDHAFKKKLLADSMTQRDDTKEQAAADEDLFEDTKASCKKKAGEWSQRSRLRASELVGIQQALDILSSPAATKTFENSSSTFLQIASFSAERARSNAYVRLRNLASKFHSLDLARIALAVKESGHFDKVITMIDDMIQLLRKEEASDIEHRDRCESGLNRNKNKLEDLQESIDKADAWLDRMANKKKDMKIKIDDLDKAILATKSEMEDRLELRNEEHKEFVQSLKDDVEAVKLLNMAMDALTKFYKKNKIPMSFSQSHEEPEKPEYAVDKDAAPETTWTGGNYGGKQEKNKGVLAILSYLVEDTKLEIKKSREDDAAAQADYEKDVAASSKVLNAQKETKSATETAIAELNEKMTDKEAFKTKASDERDAQDDMKDTLTKDCDWVKKHFDDRRTKRDAEMEGLQEAKGILAGAES